MKVKIGYARVSTQKQASGAQRDRPELQAALSYMRKGATLVVWKLDRLAHSTKQLIETIDGFRGCGIGLKSFQDPIDTSSPSGRLVFHIFAALTEFERGVIREHVTAALRAARTVVGWAAAPDHFLQRIVRPPGRC